MVKRIVSPFVNDETAASRCGLAFERAHFSPDPPNGSSPDADGRSRLVDARAAPHEPWILHCVRQQRTYQGSPEGLIAKINDKIGNRTVLA